MTARRLTLAALTLLCPAVAAAQSAPERADPALAARLSALTTGFHGKVGLYVRNLRTGATVAMDADSVFPTASLVKVPILLTLFDQVQQGKLSLDARVPYPDTLHYRFVESTDVVGYMTAGDTLPVSELAFLMLTVSDNVASLWLQALVGGGVAVNKWLAENGFDDTRVNSRTPGREAPRSTYGWGQSTPREMARALTMIREGRAVSPEASEEMYRMLSRTYWADRALSQIPPTVQVASKQGFVSRARSEVLVVSSAGGDYVLAIMTRDQEDTSEAWESEGARLIRGVSRSVYEHFNPNDPWRPRRR